MSSFTLVRLPHCHRGFCVGYRPNSVSDRTEGGLSGGYRPQLTRWWGDESSTHQTSPFSLVSGPSYLRSSGSKIGSVTEGLPGTVLCLGPILT